MRYLAINWLTSMHSPGGPPGTPGQAHATQGTSGASGGPGSVSVGTTSSLGDVNDTLLSAPAGFPQIPALDPAKPSQAGMIVFTYDGPLFGDDDSIQKVGDGSTSYYGMGNWRPRRAGEQRHKTGRGLHLDRLPGLLVAVEIHPVRLIPEGRIH